MRQSKGPLAGGPKIQTVPPPIFENLPLNVNQAAAYLEENHGLAFSPKVLFEYAETRRTTGEPWGPETDQEGNYARQALDAFAREIIQARRLRFAA